jgi:hypothetical protein
MIDTKSFTPRLLPVSPAEPITSGMPFLREAVRKSSSSSRAKCPIVVSSPR